MFLSRLTELVEASSPQTDDLLSVRRDLIACWPEIRARVEQGIDKEYAGLSPSEREMLRILEDGHSLLNPLRLARDEVVHCRALHWALTAGGPLGAGCRAAFASLVEMPPEVGAAAWRVRTEVRLGQHGRIDLLVEVPHKAVVYLEVKVDHLEEATQLVRYREHLNTRSEPFRTLAFLTKEGLPGASEAKATPMSFSDLVRAFLPYAIGDSPSHRYLASWLVTLARDVLDEAGTGPHEGWSLRHRKRALTLIRGSIDE